MKNRLIIISDLWGKEKSAWLIYYIQILDSLFSIDAIEERKPLNENFFL